MPTGRRSAALSSVTLPKKEIRAIFFVEEATVAELFAFATGQAPPRT